MAFRPLPPNIKPYLRRNMERNDLHGCNTICAIVQDIYLNTDDEDIKVRCRVIMRMSKSMHNRLVEYKKLMEGISGLISDNTSKK